MPPLAALGAAVLGAGAATGAAAVGMAAVGYAAVGGMVIGAVLGGVTAAIKGDNVLKGALKGAVIGGIAAAVVGVGQAAGLYGGAAAGGAEVGALTAAETAALPAPGIAGLQGGASLTAGQQAGGGLLASMTTTDKAMTAMAVGNVVKGAGEGAAAEKEAEAAERIATGVTDAKKASKVVSITDELASDLNPRLVQTPEQWSRQFEMPDYRKDFTIAQPATKSNVQYDTIANIS